MCIFYLSCRSLNFIVILLYIMYVYFLILPLLQVSIFNSPAIEAIEVCRANHLNAQSL